MVRTLMTSIVGLTLTGCLYSAQTGSSADTLDVNVKPALPMTGSWVATDLWGFTQDENGKVSKLYASKENLDRDSWKVEFNLDSQGDGYISGRTFCKAKAKKIEGIGNDLSGSRILLTANGIVGGLYLIASVVEMGQCLSSKDGFVDVMLPVTRANNFFGQPFARIDKNLGFVGEGVSSNAADNECRKLRGVRYISINKSVSCMGFQDSKANRIRFVGVPAGSVYAIRVDFMRD